MTQLTFPPSPIQLIDEFSYNNAKLYIKREDLIHPDFGGNKWRKLKYNMEAYKDSDCSCIISFGGPFSNHIAALANICHAYNIPCVGIIRGEYVDAKNPTLLKAKAKGMVMHHISKEEYSLKEASDVVKELIAQYERPFVLPEGGSNTHAFKGVCEIQEELVEQEINPDIIFVAAGTGMTAAGIIEKSSDNQKVIVINIMRNEDMANLISSYLSRERSNWVIIDSYDFGGYAKITPRLINHINHFYKQKEIPLDPVYNGKVSYGIYDLAVNNLIPENSRLLQIHTGGLQGIKAYNYCCKKESLKLLSH